MKNECVELKMKLGSTLNSRPFSVRLLSFAKKRILAGGWLLRSLKSFPKPSLGWILNCLGLLAQSRATFRSVPKNNLSKDSFINYIVILVSKIDSQFKKEDNSVQSLTVNSRPIIFRTRTLHGSRTAVLRT